MISKNQVCISQEMYKDFRVIMWFTRLVGMFPFVVRQTRHGLVLKWSPWVAAYSYAFGLVVLGMGYYGELLDVISNDRDSIKVRTSTDLIVVLLAFSSFCIVNFCGFFIMPMKTLQLFAYLKCINQVDAIIHTKYKRFDRFKSAMMLAALVLAMVLISVAVCYVAYLVMGAKIGLPEILKRNIGGYSVFTLIAVVSYMNRHMAYSLEKRLLRLNKILKTLKMAKPPALNTVAMRRLDFSCSDDTIVQLSKAYLKLMDAVNILNSLLGINTLIMIISVMFLLTVSLYFLVLLLQGKGQGSIAVLPRIGLMIMHFVRVLLITEPWYACLVQVELLKGHVCSFSSWKVDRRLRKQVDAFAMVICLRPFEVSACGFFSVDRTLFTSLIETITTIVVILLQAEENDEK